MHGVKRTAMHFLLSAIVLGAALTAGMSSQTLAPRPSAVQHVTAQTSTAPAGGGATKRLLHVDVTPYPNIHVYAEGAQEFTPVSLVLTPAPGIAAGKPSYPKADPALAPGADPTPAYRKTFRITQPVTLTSAKQDVEISGVLNYQACDERLCYPVASLPVSWKITAR